MEITLILIEKILSLFLIMFLGGLMVRLKLVRAEESRSMSVLSLYVIMPCVIISSFEIECTPDILGGLLLAFGAAVALNAMLLVLLIPLDRVLHLDALEKATVMYSNAGNLVIPLVTALLGPEYVIYSSAFISVQSALFWSHGKAMLCGEKGLDLKKILTNVNLISVAVGVFVFFTGFRFPAVVEDTIHSLSSMVGPLAMLITGMYIGEMDLHQLLRYKRLPLVVFLRLVAVPLMALAFLRLSGLSGLVPGGRTVLLISLLAMITPSASTVTQMAQVYGLDAVYASAINVATTLLCLVTMPVMVFLYQL